MCIIFPQKLKPDYTQTEDLVVDVLALRYKDMSYHRELLLPDVLHEPVPETETESDAYDIEVINKITISARVCDFHL